MRGALMCSVRLIPGGDVIPGEVLLCDVQISGV
jgi:hypothetical protein